MRALLLYLVASCLCWSADEPAILARNREAVGAAKRLRCAFTLTRHLELFDKPLECVGVLEIDRELRAVRWEFTGELLVILKDGKLRRWDGEGTGEVIAGADPGARMLERQMAALLDGRWGELSRRFAVRAGETEGSVTMTPTDEDLLKVVAGIDLRFDPATAWLVGLVIRAPTGDRSVYAFAAPEIDGEIPAARYDGP